MSRQTLSFEFFPPKSLDGAFRLWDCIHALSPLEPDFVSVTYGAGGTTRDLTHDAVATLTKRTGLNVAAHLTCVEATREETLKIANDYAEAGVGEIVALRGDPPDGARSFTPHPDGFAGSVDLIEALAATGRFTLRAAAYPESHPEAIDPVADIVHLKRKIQAGASSAITQFFFDADTFLRFRDACAAAGIDAPILPGILPVENWAGVQKFASRCGTRIPRVVSDGFGRCSDRAEADLFATAIATELCDTLRGEGVEHFHFYTLNRPELTRDVCHALGLVPPAALEQVA